MVVADPPVSDLADCGERDLLDARGAAASYQRAGPAELLRASYRHLIHRLPLVPRDAAFLAATFLTVDFLAADFLAVLAVDFLVVVVFADAFLAIAFLAVDALAGDFLGSVPPDLAFFLSRAGSILAAPGPGANKLSCPSFHRTRYWIRRSPSITSMISPSRAGPPTRRGLRTMRSPFLATRPPSCLPWRFGVLGNGSGDYWGSRLRSVRHTLIARGVRRGPDLPCNLPPLPSRCTLALVSTEAKGENGAAFIDEGGLAMPRPA
jgi:hypothetical protein